MERIRPFMVNLELQIVYLLDRHHQITQALDAGQCCDAEAAKKEIESLDERLAIAFDQHERATVR